MVGLTGNESDKRNRNSLDLLFDSLANRERRRIVGLVFDRAPEAVSREELVTSMTVDKCQRATTALDHVHLPKLSAAGLIDRNSDDNTVALADHPAFQDPGIREIIEDDGSTSDPSLDALFSAIADGRRRTILDILSHQFGPIHVETLAWDIETYDEETRESEVPTAAVNRVVKRLHHVDLPHLSETGLIEYDTDARTVTYEGHPQLRVPWIHSVLKPEFRRSLTGESDPNGIGEIQGREQVISFGQSLCDRADEELFCMFTDTQLLEAGCLTRIRDASRRGTTVYLGTQDPDIREYVRENAPDVVLWEPNTNWLNLPSAGDRVGRLLLADREAVMLGTLLEETNDGFHEEQAIIGEGEHNTLVTMICQLLGPHLEEIDEGTEDIEARLPL